MTDDLKPRLRLSPENKALVEEETGLPLEMALDCLTRPEVLEPILNAARAEGPAPDHIGDANEMIPAPEPQAEVRGLVEAARALMSQFEAYREGDLNHASAHNLLTRYGMWRDLEQALASINSHQGEK